MDEDNFGRDACFILCNKNDSGDKNPLTKKVMVDFSPPELEYLKILVECIITR